MAMILIRDLRDIIVIVVAFDTLYDNFDTKIISLLKTRNKIINKILSIL